MVGIVIQSCCVIIFGVNVVRDKCGMKEHPRGNGAERALLGTCQAGCFSRVPGRRVDRDVST